MCGEPIAERTSHPQTLNVEDILYDDNFRGMKDHFLMCGRGRRPALPSLPLLNNQVLVQLFHLREQGSATWDEVATWFEKLFPKKILSRGRVKAVRSGV
ncbi:hypothetical protein RRG08_025514 [Elysia crispata]|uniref:Uncharacterized protein n=1 Tax=Elysia crispata TaxID=231223 RepID=A0AAE1A206_9GAST|nr:hypothetical protein RRG08_025514 [Elysia crispata]